MRETPSCRKYWEHYQRVGDANILGQVLRIECQLSLTNFDDDESVKLLRHVVLDAIEKIKEKAQRLGEQV